MRVDTDGNRRFEQRDKRRILSAASLLNLNQDALATRISPAAADPSRHLRAVLSGRVTLTTEYFAKLAEALTLDVTDLERLLEGGTFALSTPHTLRVGSLPAAQPTSPLKHFAVVHRLALPSNWSPEAFYNGYRPEWEDLEAGYDVKRLVYSRPQGLNSTLRQTLKAMTRLHMVAIIGVAGTGKSTLLRRAAYDLAKDGYLVLTPAPGWTQHGTELFRELQTIWHDADRPAILVLDDLYDSLHEGSPLSALIEQLSHSPLLLLVTEHPDRWRGVTKRLPTIVEGDNCVVQRVHQLDREECRTLVDRIVQLESAGALTPLCSMTREERVAFSIGRADRHLVVVMLEIRHGQRFRQIIEHEVAAIPTKSGVELYGLVCYFETLQLYLPQPLVLRLLNPSDPMDVEDFFDGTDGLFQREYDGWRSRHLVIARTVSRCVFSRPETKQVALVKVVSALDLSQPRESDLFTRLFAGAAVYKRLISDLNQDSHLVDGFYTAALGSIQSKNKEAGKYVLTSHGQACRLLNQLDRARTLFDQALALDGDYSFAHRQLAWLALAQRQLTAAIEHIRRAIDLEPSNPRTLRDAALIMEAGTIDTFRLAGQYWNRAAELDPADADISRRHERYAGAADELKAYGSTLRESDLIPDFVFDGLRFPLLLRKLRYSAGHGKIRNALKNELQLMQQDTQGSPAELDDRMAGVTVGRDDTLKGLRIANIARLQFIAWREQNETIGEANIRRLFESGIQLNPKDPFVHCWYGTFLKEVESDFVGAAVEYDRAIALARGGDRLFVDHPLFLNNKALLIIDEVMLDRREPKDLIEAVQLLVQAVARVPDTKPDFFWAEYNLDWCRQVMTQFNVTAA